MTRLAPTLIALGFGVFLVGAWLVHPGDADNAIVGGITVAGTILVGAGIFVMFLMQVEATADKPALVDAEEVAAAVEKTRKELLAIAEVAGDELARLRADNAWLREALTHIDKWDPFYGLSWREIARKALAGSRSRLKPSDATTRVENPYDRGLCGALHEIFRDGMSVRLVCQRPIGHDGEHSHTSRGAVTTAWPNRSSEATTRVEPYWKGKGPRRA